jgi:predicted dehydrogenase
LAHPTSGGTRRDFLATSAGVGLMVLPGLLPTVHAAGSDALRVALIGCGGRGTGAAEQALKAHPNNRLVVMADMFKDKLDYSLKALQRIDEISKQIEVKPESCFVGFDAYKQVMASNVDVVLLTTPPGFRPLHLAAAVEAGKHVFAEKPVAVDAPGVRSVLESARKAKEKGLCLVSGFCWRKHPIIRETMKRVHDGAIGEIRALQCSYNTGALWSHKREEGWSDMEYQLRNWLYYTWLSGDHIAEQACHSIDKMAWAMKDESPIKAIGLGGRQTRTAELFGNIFDHHSVVFEYKNGVKLFHSCRQQIGCAHDVSDHVFGEKGICDINVSKFPPKVRISGPNPWTSNPKDNGNMYQIEHDELFAAIRAGKPINEGESMAHSTLMSIMGRMATYTGKEITWEMAMNSKEDLTPAKYELGPIATPPVARPGFTAFV